MSVGNVNQNSLLRSKQLERYFNSDMHKMSSAPRTSETSKVKFQNESVFLAACSSGDLEEAKRLLDKGIDINIPNVDGLTALHQACIYQRLEMVKFLVEQSADVNTFDNDGWTPLHAACSRESVDIARYLLDHGSKLDAISFDGELPLDVAENDEMHQLLSKAMKETGIVEENARKQEEEQMLVDANEWVKNGTDSDSVVDPKTGATPLHVAAGRGYVNVMQILLQAGAKVNAQDHDGWTPLHAAAHWGHRDACQMLVEHYCDINIKDLSGLMPQDVAVEDLGDFIEELKKKQLTMYGEIRNIKRTSFSGKRRGSVSRLSFDQRQVMLQKNIDEERSKMELILAKRTGIRTQDQTGVEEENEEEDTEAQMIEEMQASNDVNTVENRVVELSSASGAKAVGQKETLEKIEDDVFVENASEGMVENDINANRKEDAIAGDETLKETHQKKTSEPLAEEQKRISYSKNDGNRKEPHVIKNLHGIQNINHEFYPVRTASPSSRPGASAADASNGKTMVLGASPLLSSATKAALATIASSHIWSLDETKRDEEVSRKTRSIRARETRRPTQGVTKEDLDKTEAVLSKVNGNPTAESEQQVKKPSDMLPYTKLLSDKLSVEKTTLDSASKKEDLTLTLYRRGSRDTGVVPGSELDDDESSSRLALLQKRRRVRESRKPTGQVNLENHGDGFTVKQSEVPASSAQAIPSAERKAPVPSATPQSSLLVDVDSRAERHTASFLSSSLNQLCVPDSKTTDYEQLYKKERLSNELLQQQVKQLQQELNEMKCHLGHISQSNRLNSKIVADTNFDTKENGALERIAELEEKFKNYETLEADNRRLKDENAALIRVISKLSR